jgi:hypothetical protein
LDKDYRERELDIQMLELLRKELRAEREAAEKRADDRFKAWRKRRPPCEKSLSQKRKPTRAETRAIQARTETMREEMHAERKRSEHRRPPCETNAEKMEPDSEVTQSAVEHQEVPVQDATVMPVREPEEEMTSIIRKETMACQKMEAHLEEK